MTANKRLAPVRHAGVSGGHDDLAAQEVGGLEQVDRHALRAAELQRLGNVGRVDEAVVHLHAPEARRQRRDLHPLLERNPRHLVEDHRQDQVVLVQHLVVLEVVHQRLGHGVRVGHGVDGRARHAVGAVFVQRVDEGQQLGVVAAHGFDQQLAPTTPGGHDGEQRGAQHQREPATLQELERARHHQQRVQRQEHPGGGQGHGQRVAPGVAHDKEGEPGGDQHGHGHRNAVGRGQRRGAAKAQHRQQHGHQQQPVHLGHVDLAGLLGRGELHPHARQQPELHGLAGHGIGARNHRLRGDHRGQRGQHHGGDEPALREQAVEGVFQPQTGHASAARPGPCS
jgi:hypothetical protein